MSTIGLRRMYKMAKLVEPDITQSVPKNKQRNIIILENADDFVSEECTESGVRGSNDNEIKRA